MYVYTHTNTHKHTYKQTNWQLAHPKEKVNQMTSETRVDLSRDGRNRSTVDDASYRKKDTNGHTPHMSCLETPVSMCVCAALTNLTFRSSTLLASGGSESLTLTSAVWE